MNDHLGRDMLVAAMMIVAGVAISGFSLAQIRAHDRMHVAQAPAPSPTPAESMPGGTRPTTPAPEPATPKPDAQKQGAQPALPPAPAEKVAPPIKDK
jgi:hypothetical protein